MKDLDALAEEFLERHRRGEWPQISEYVERYPDLAEDIREVFPPLVALERAAQTGPGSDTTRIGPYRLLHLLGRGGQGEVHLAEDTRLGRQVALKVLPPGADPARFKREAAITARLDHPGICTVYEAGQDRGTAFIAMRYVEGESLAERLASDAGAASSATRDGCVQFVAMAEKVARALDVAHGAGLIHRDIKPGNIMLTPDGEPVILDFGLARDIADDEPALTHTGMMMGTPIYMSPEQILAQRQRVDHRTDVYSLGVTLYECLTGRRPFEAATWDQLYNQILSVEPENPRRLNPVIPKDLRVVLATAMDKDRDRRYQSAAAFADDLRNVRELQPIHAKPAGPVLRARRWAQRNPVLATSVAALFVALTAGLIVTAVLLGDARAERDAKARALTKANGLSLAAQSLAIVERDPGLALALAVEASARAPGPQANDALLRALASNREIARIESKYQFSVGRPTLSFCDGGRTIFSPGMLHAFWDVESRAPIDKAWVNRSALAVSPDESWLVTSGVKRQLVDLRSDGGARRRLRVPPGLVGSSGGRASFSADSSLVAVDGDVWRVADAKFVGRFKHSVVFAPGGPEFLAWNRARVEHWSEQTGRATVFEAKGGKIVAASWERVFVGTSGGIRVFDRATGQARTALLQTPAPVVVAWVDARGRSLFAVTDDAMCRLWSVDDGKERCAFPLAEDFPDPWTKHPARRAKSLMSVRFGPRGERMLVSSRWYDDAVLIDTGTGDRYARLRGHEAGIEASGFHPSGDTVATYSADGTLRLWYAGRETPVVRMETPGERCHSVEFAADGRTVVAAATDGKVYIWDRATGRLAKRIDAGTDRAHVVGRLLCGFPDAEDDNDLQTVRLWDAATGAAVEVPGALRDSFEEFTLSDDRTRLATVRDGRVRVIALADGALLADIDTGGGEADNTTLALGPHGRFVATSFGSEETTVWSVASGRSVATIKVPQGVDHLRITPDGKSAVVVDGSLNARVLDLDSGRELAVFRGHRAWVVSTEIGPNGRYFATVSMDGTARVMDLVTRKTLYALSPGAGGLNTVRIGPRAERLLLLTYDGAAFLYDLKSGDLIVRPYRAEGRLIENAYLLPGGLLADFSPDGTHVVTTSWSGAVRIWPVQPAAAPRARTLTKVERARYLEPLREDYEALREARRLVDTLRNDLLIKQDVIDRIRADRGLGEAARMHALRLAEEGEANVWVVETALWHILHASDRTPADYRFAERLVHEAGRIGGANDTDPVIANAGVDLRLGRYAKAAEALATVDRSKDQTARGFYAIALVRLGRKQEARKEIDAFLEAFEETLHGEELKAEVEALLPR